MEETKQLDGLSMDNIEKIAAHYKEILKLLGEDPEREGLVKTPMRAAKAMAFLTRGYRLDASKIVRSALFSHEGSRMVVIRDIEFYSLCEHHILPFFGTVTVGYVPKGKIVGLSKVARIVEVFARRLQVQERMTRQICESLAVELNAEGVIVMSRASHMCMRMRGVEKENSSTQSLEYCGVFEKPECRNEFFNLLQTHEIK